MYGHPAKTEYSVQCAFKAIGSRDQASGRLLSIITKIRVFIMLALLV